MRLIRDGRRGWGGGGGGMEVGEREIIYLSRHCHHQNDSCIKMGSDESLLMFQYEVVDGVHKPQPF